MEAEDAALRAYYERGMERRQGVSWRHADRRTRRPRRHQHPGHPALPPRRPAAEPARKANGYREYSLRDAVELAGLFDRMAHVAAERPGPEPAMAAKDRDLMALLETAAPARGTGWLDVLTRTLNSDPGAVERAYAVYARLDELAGAPADDPRVEATAQAIVAAIPEPARQAIRFPDGHLEEADEGFFAAFYADFPPAQAAAIRRAVDLMRESRRADEDGQETTS
jgi:hypothetical protein